METKPTVAKEPIAAGQRGVVLRSFDDMQRFANAASASGLVPKSLDTPAKILIALQTGMEAGLAPAQSLRSIVVINGMPSWKGDSAKGLVLAAGLLEPGTSFAEWFEGKGDEYGCTVTAHRRGSVSPVSREFTIGDAKRAGLWDKAGPWKQFPKRMLMYRALGFLLRDVFPDVLMGLYTAEEAIDVPSDREPELRAVEVLGADPLLEPQGTVEVFDIRPAKAPGEPAVEFPWDEPSGSTEAPDADEQALVEWQSACVDLDPEAQVVGLDLGELKALHAKLEAR